MFGKNKNSVEITVSNKTIIRVIGLVIISALAINFLNNILHPLTLIFVSFFLALALNPIVTKVARKLKSKSRTRATALAYLAVISTLILFLSLVIPPLVSQTTEFVRDIPQTLSDLENNQGAVGNFIRENNLESQINDLSDNWQNYLGEIRGPVVSTANRVLSNLISIITVLILTFMMLVEGPKWISVFWKQYPKSKREHAQTLAQKMSQVVTRYAVGQVSVAAVGAMCSIIALLIATTVFDVNDINPIALGGIVFLLSLIPTIGTIISTALVVIFCSFASIPLAITMLIYFIVYQQIENATIQPLIQAKGIDLSPMLVFIAAIVGIGFGGLLGAIISIPIAGCAKILVEDYLYHRSETKEI
jgi:predicted PurR-regulated permease PerM